MFESADTHMEKTAAYTGPRVQDPISTFGIVARGVAVGFAILFYAPLTLLFFGSILPRFDSFLGHVTFGRHLLLPGLAALVIAVLYSGPKARLWNDWTFGTIFFLEFVMWSASISYFLFLEIVFYDELSIWILLWKSGIVAGLCLGVSLCFLFSSSWTKLLVPLYLVALIVAEFIRVHPMTVVYWETPPPVPTSIAGDYGTGGSRFSQVPNLWMYSFYFLALLYVFALRGRGEASAGAA